MKKYFKLLLYGTLTFFMSGSGTIFASSFAPFTKDLNIGASGTEVTRLQNYLAENGHLNVSARGYYGQITKKAVISYQKSAGINPSSGFFGPKTRGVLNASLTSKVTVTPVAPSVPTVPAIVTQPTIVNKGESLVRLALASSPTNGNNIQAFMDVPVYALEAKATQADARIDRLDLQVDITNGANHENPATYIGLIKVWDGTTTLATIPVSSDTFIKDSNSVYYARLSGFSLYVPKDQTKTLTVSFTTNPMIDSNRTATIKGYGTNAVRVSDSASSNVTYDASSFIRTQTFSKPGNATVSMSADPNLLTARNYRISPTDGAKDAELMSFMVHPEGSPIGVSNVYVSITSLSTNPTTVKLYDADKLVSAKSLPAGTSSAVVNFDDLLVIIMPDEYHKFTIKVDMPATTVAGSGVLGAAATVVYGLGNGIGTYVATTVLGEFQYFYPAIPVFTLQNTSAMAMNAANGSTTALVGTFNIKVKANGNSMTLPVASDFSVKVGTSSASAVSVSSVAVSVAPNNNISDGGEATVTVVGTANPAILTARTQNQFFISSIAWTVGTSTATQTWGLRDFLTTVPVYFIQ